MTGPERPCDETTERTTAPAKVIVTADYFTIVCTLTAAFFNLLSIVTVLIIFLVFLMPKINTGVATVERGEKMTKEIAEETRENRARVVKTQAILEKQEAEMTRQWKEMEKQRQTMTRMNEFLRQWEDRMLLREKKGAKP